MPILTSYVCDKCTHAQSTPHKTCSEDRNMYQVGITCEPLGTAFHTPLTRQSALFCGDCVTSMGVLRPLIAADVAPKYPTIEDIVRDIAKKVQEEGE